MPVADLIAVASRALSDRVDLSHGLARAAGALAPALAAMLAERNGFYAFGPALHVLSTAELALWNAPTSPARGGTGARSCTPPTSWACGSCSAS